MLRTRDLVNNVVRRSNQGMSSCMQAEPGTCSSETHNPFSISCVTDSSVQLVCCYPEDAEALTRSPFIKHITFIGSEEVGRKVCRSIFIQVSMILKRVIR